MTGLGWIDAETQRFRFEDSRLKVPHVGWNVVRVVRDNPLFRNIPQDSRFYFTHSYHVRCHQGESVLANTTYGHEFASTLHHDNIYGTQFHPEKSHRVGIQMISNFREHISRC